MNAIPLPQEHAQTVNQLLLSLDWKIALLLLAGIAAIQFIFSIWLRTRLENSIKQEYAIEIEDYKFEIETRKRAEKVADYLSQLFSNPNAKSLELNKTAWELSLWLPSKTYHKLAVAVSEKRDIRSFKEVLIDVRKVLLKDKEDGLQWDNILHHIDQA